jgi:uncharacterized membrane protein (UPF0127 family)
MRSFSLIAVFAGALGFVSGCEKPPTTTVAPAAAVSNQVASQAQPKLPTVKLWLGAEELNTEVARTLPQLQTGMMFRESMDEKEGMLFLLPFPQRASFYMRNTLIPLTCAYINAEGEILEIHDMKPKDETPILSATERILFVLETRQGWFERHKIGVGTEVRTERGSLKETFYRSR